MGVKMDEYWGRVAVGRRTSRLMHGTWGGSKGPAERTPGGEKVIRIQPESITGSIMASFVKLWTSRGAADTRLAAGWESACSVADEENNLLRKRRLESRITGLHNFRYDRHLEYLSARSKSILGSKSTAWKSGFMK